MYTYKLSANPARRTCPLQMEARVQCHLRALFGAHHAAAAANRRGLVNGVGAHRADRMCARRGQRSVVHSVHVGHHGQAEGHSEADRWPLGNVDVHDENAVRIAAGRRMVGGLGSRLGCRAFVHLLWAVVIWQYKCVVRGKARADTGSGAVFPVRLRII